jgi:hypothetical protein
MGARPLPFWTCEQCGAQFPDSGEPPVSCPVCEDERQFVNWKGHAWLTREELAKRHKLVWREDLGISGIGVEPGFAIGQRALLVREPDGCVLWDCVPLLTNEAVEHIRSLGGLKAIAVSHPHYYGAVADWSEAFGGAPIYLHADDRAWITRPHPGSCRGPGKITGCPMTSFSCAPAGISPAPPLCIGAPVPKAEVSCSLAIP